MHADCRQAKPGVTRPTPFEPDSEFQIGAPRFGWAARAFACAVHVEARATIRVYGRVCEFLFDALSMAFKGVKAMLHGKMRKDDQGKVMAAFRDGEAHVLLLPVVEVGIDVPDATAGD